MMKKFSIYSAATGMLTGGCYSTNHADPAEFVRLNTPDGHGAVDGHHDHLSQRVDLDLLNADGGPATAAHVVDYKPPSPSPNHEWHEQTKRWKLTVAASDQATRTQLLAARKSELHKRQADPLRRLLLNPQDEAARKSLHEIDDGLSEVNDELASAAAMTRETE